MGSNKNNFHYPILFQRYSSQPQRPWVWKAADKSRREVESAKVQKEDLYVRWLTIFQKLSFLGMSVGDTIIYYYLYRAPFILQCMCRHWSQQQKKTERREVGGKGEQFHVYKQGVFLRLNLNTISPLKFWVNFSISAYKLINFAHELLCTVLGNIFFWMRVMLSWSNY